MPIYMQFPGVTGTGTGKHKGWVELQSAQIGVHRNVKHSAVGGANGRDSNTPETQEFSLTKLQDIASADLFRIAVAGGGEKVVIDFVQKDSKNDVPYLSIEMEAAFVTSFTMNGHPDRDGRAMENLMLTATKVKYSATPTEASRDPKDQRDRTGWDVVTVPI